MEIDGPIERLETGRDSFDRLLRPELASAYRLAGYMLCDASAAEDAAQEAVLRAWRAYPTLRDHSQFGPWLQRIVANVCRDQRRRRRLVRFVPLDGAFEEPRPAIRSALPWIAWQSVEPSLSSRASTVRSSSCATCSTSPMKT